jgi:hypothetical protein
VSQMFCYKFDREIKFIICKHTIIYISISSVFPCTIKKKNLKMLEGLIVHEHYPKYLENPIVSAKSTFKSPQIKH